MTGVSGRRARVAAHYDELSPHYADLWGEHIHHGYYRRGDESRAEATRALVDRLVEDMGLPTGAAVLDVGCGIGGTAHLLAREHSCRVTGVTLSPVQACMAARRSEADGSPTFVVGDASSLPFVVGRPISAPGERTGLFDAVLALEVLSHLERRDPFFAQLPGLLAAGGRVGIAAWLRASGLDRAAESRYIDPIEEGMIVTLPTREEYEHLCADHGLELIRFRDVSAEVARTWDLCLELVSAPAVWSLAMSRGRDTVAFVRTFRAMRAGFASGAFRYALIAAVTK